MQKFIKMIALFGTIDIHRWTWICNLCTATNALTHTHIHQLEKTMLRFNWLYKCFNNIFMWQANIVIYIINVIYVNEYIKSKFMRFVRLQCISRCERARWSYAKESHSALFLSRLFVFGRWNLRWFLLVFLFDLPIDNLWTRGIMRWTKPFENLLQILSFNWRKMKMFFGQSLFLRSLLVFYITDKDFKVQRIESFGRVHSGNGMLVVCLI